MEMNENVVHKYPPAHKPSLVLSNTTTNLKTKSSLNSSCQDAECKLEKQCGKQLLLVTQQRYHELQDKYQELCEGQQIQSKEEEKTHQQNWDVLFAEFEDEKSHWGKERNQFQQDYEQLLAKYNQKHEKYKRLKQHCRQLQEQFFITEAKLKLVGEEEQRLREEKYRRTTDTVEKYNDTFSIRKAILDESKNERKEQHMKMMIELREEKEKLENTLQLHFEEEKRRLHEDRKAMEDQRRKLLEDESELKKAKAEFQDLRNRTETSRTNKENDITQGSKIAEKVDPIDSNQYQSEKIQPNLPKSITADEHFYQKECQKLLVCNRIMSLRLFKIQHENQILNELKKQIRKAKDELNNAENKSGKPSPSEPNTKEINFFEAPKPKPIPTTSTQSIHTKIHKAKNTHEEPKEVLPPKVQFSPTLYSKISNFGVPKHGLKIDEEKVSDDVGYSAVVEYPIIHTKAGKDHSKVIQSSVTTAPPKSGPVSSLLELAEMDMDDLT